MRKLLIALTVLAVLFAGTPALAAKSGSTIQGPCTGGGILSPATGGTIQGPCTGGGIL